MFQKAIDSVNPYHLVKNCLRFENNQLIVTELSKNHSYYINRNVKIIAAGKAVGGMTHAVQELLRDHILYGIVSLPHGYQNAFSNHLEIYPLLNNEVYKLNTHVYNNY